MKSRWTIGLLIAAAVAVWGVVGWKILAPGSAAAPAAVPMRSDPVVAAAAVDTLRLDYADPFLKDAAGQAPAGRSVVRRLPPAKKTAPARERVPLVHLGTVAAAGKVLHILRIGTEQYELHEGEAAADFVLKKVDRDSLYLCRKGVRYGVKRCQ